MPKSSYSEKVRTLLEELFPYHRIKEDEAIYIRGYNKVLYADFVVGDFLIVEVDGQQHEQFNEFFHGSLENFRSYKRRDELKEMWARENGYVFVRIPWNQVDSLTKEDLLATIIDAKYDEE